MEDKRTIKDLFVGMSFDESPSAAELARILGVNNYQVNNAIKFNRLDVFPRLRPRKQGGRHEKIIIINDKVFNLTFTRYHRKREKFIVGGVEYRADLIGVECSDSNYYKSRAAY